MRLLSDIVRDADENLGLDRKAPVLVAEAVRFLFLPSHGGLKGFLDRLEKEGHGVDLRNWMSPVDEIRVPEGKQLESILGVDKIASLGRDLGMANARVRTALAYVIPRLIRYFTAGGHVPDQLPSSVEEYLASPFSPGIAPQSRSYRPRTHGKRRKLAGGASQTSRFIWAAGVIVLLVSGYIMGRDIYERTPHAAVPAAAGNTVPAAPAAQGAAPVQEAGAKPSEAPGVGSKLVIRNIGGQFEYLGYVNSPASRQSVLEIMQKSLGGGKISGDILVDQARSEPLWLGQLSHLLPFLNVPGLDVRLEGNTVRVGGWLAEEDRNSILNTVMSALGSSYRYGYLREEEMERLQDSRQYMNAALPRIGADAKPSELVAVLNRWVIPFQDGTSVIPDDSREIASKVASVLQTLRISALYEIQGYVDADPNQPQATKLSQSRANAVRDALIQAGVAEGKLKARGLGGDKRFASGEAGLDHARNERIAFRVIQLCDPYFPCDASKVGKRASEPALNETYPGVSSTPVMDGTPVKATSVPSEAPAAEKPAQRAVVPNQEDREQEIPTTTGSRLKALSEEMAPLPKPKPKTPPVAKPADPKSPEWYDPLGIF